MSMGSSVSRSRLDARSIRQRVRYAEGVSPTMAGKRRASVARETETSSASASMVHGRAGSVCIAVSSGPPAPRIFGEHAAIRRDYPIDEFADHARPLGVTASVYVQVNVAPGDEVEEVEWASAAGRTCDLVQAVVGFADLEDPAVGDLLDAQAERAPLRGIRQQLHWHTDPAYRFATAPDVMLRPAWQRGLRAVQDRGLLFE